MTKPLSELTLEELWQLFPISLTEPQKQWATDYEQESSRIRKILQNVAVVRISHIGSTAIKNIWAKSIVDILVEVSPKTNLVDVAEQLSRNGYIIMSDEKERISLNKGYTVHGFAKSVYHLHLRFAGDNDELYFRDYLNNHPEVAKKYETLKIKLWHQFEHNRDAYTKAKGEFIQKYTKLAKTKYRGRYV
ncbi:GrpB family protein [Lacticaseibacillus casei]|uniref:GrpB family protein n=1 Tax=Lacticaseibacillus TaxID=2759736 RepID=UPI000666D9E2|nr:MULTISPECIES: GrpB family protein [Lacticaseibacillus]QVI38656.1 GrpB family protein [Lacticaseibacillus casei]WFB42466.1 GrpB family protein [Lacticaseibacillus huelsenbergensis]